LAALAVIGVLGLVRMTTRAAWVVESRLDAQQHARRAVERLTEELRWAEDVVADPGCAPGGLCADRVTVRIPAGNPYRRDLAYDVLFQRDARGRELERRVGRGVNNLASSVDRLSVAYFTAAGAPAVRPEDVTSIRIALVVTPPGGPPAVVESEVALRNRRVPLSTPTLRPVWRPSPRGPWEPIPPDRVVPVRPPGPSEPR
ncbi:MAG: hypothetical protein HY355_04110, partial [Armatimonadetes bacterium]|nr:hypothetical protein [Armatimonadota bacterium]